MLRNRADFLMTGGETGRGEKLQVIDDRQAQFPQGVADGEMRKCFERCLVIVLEGYGPSA